ncbi:hypothetical protein [Paractinoplanes lichenicola]|uniref:Uncharacterized protein n=1 Tax=Paractinoplanes lichenicola TaxID=2802976 RepID=A0ABS1W5R0_9ACTN|nr:hypothetical protein [Actinoplanes lichenicola]MBL7262072.1 hypothetical protein [Actinoplanes lichenicola]
MKRKAIGTALAGMVAATAAIFGTSSPAMAAPVRSDACGAWACGSATFTFSGDKLSINPISLSVRDPLCNNGNKAFVLFEVDYVTGANWVTPKRRYDDDPCDGSPATFSMSKASNGRIISRARVIVADNVNGNIYGNWRNA